MEYDGWFLTGKVTHNLGSDRCFSAAGRPEMITTLAAAMMQPGSHSRRLRSFGAANSEPRRVTGSQYQSNVQLARMAASGCMG
jgi:hypothetical protein